MHLRLFTAGMALIIGCATPLVLGELHQHTVEQVQHQADARSSDQLQLARELPGTPPDVVGAFVDLLAEGGVFAAQESCLMFDAHAAAEFAEAYAQPNCVTAMRTLQSQVIDPAAYVNGLSVPDAAWYQIGSTASLNGCVLNWSGPLADTPAPAPGPLPGQWTLTQLDDEGWQITGYEPC